MLVKKRTKCVRTMLVYVINCKALFFNINP